ncbi:hypothetical protein [Mycolicibacterium sphagni]|uniref:ESX-1 secretion-associated protein n=1 Tax=Mycolicibacterium sphagni TaxID=1786 RepID=A0A255D7R5_9MYCO|nr:hypothetical protein [Mycolicibacterium sphagni]OYN75284.1 hypothetical protein CG716_25745 [Mycolicibacterium sphagni]
MPEPVVVDTATLAALLDRLTRTAAELSAVQIARLDALPGSALGSSDASRRVTADVRRLGTDVQEWVCVARRSVDELAAADDAAARLRMS